MADGTIGNVGVEVTPDATNFWRKFKADTLAQARANGEQLGRVLGDELGDAAGAESRERIQAALRHLSGNVDLNTAEARAKIAALQLQLDALSRSRSGGGNGGRPDLGGIGAGATGASNSIRSFLIPAVGLALTALGPLVAVGGAAFGTALLGAKGLESEVKNKLTPVLGQLESAATGALAPGISAALTNLQQGLPKLTPLLNIFGAAIGGELDKFTKYLNDGGFQSFANYAARELPIVESAFNSLATAGVKFFSAITPLGNDLLVTLTKTADVLGFISDTLGSSGNVNPNSAASTKLAYSLGGGKGDSGNGVVNFLHDVFSFDPSNIGQSSPKPKNTISVGSGQAGGLASTLSSQTPSSAQAALGAGQLAIQLANAASAQKNLAALESSGNTAVQGLTAAMNTYSKSAGTAADKASLLGAALKASQGDALSYTGALANGSQAFKDFAAGFDKTERAAINAKTGLIDYRAQGAAPLIQSLQNMQDGAEKAAEAVYQHEAAIHGSGIAGVEASKIFEQMTRGTLVQNAKQLGITGAEAKNLADQYFRYDGKTVKTSIEAIGLANVNTSLDKIAETLEKIAGTYIATVIVNANVQGNLASTYASQVPAFQIAGAVGKGSAATSAGNIKKLGATPNAAGTSSLAEGWNSFGEQGIEYGYKSGSHVQIFNHAQTTAMAAQMPASSPMPPIQLTIEVPLDGKVIARSTNEINMYNQGRR